ncbi:hypothetical protein FXO37_27969 [Capsicum annuum]|nr:hypothetical protein FXO37_27969 [Capsicum annuum]
MKADGTIDKYKARLVVKGFKQKEGLDYFDTYSPVTRITSIRMLISLAAVYGLEIHQMNVKTAFLNGELEEEIYMEQPEGFVVPGKENKTCITRSTMKSESIALDKASEEAEWLQNFFEDIPYWPKPMALSKDNVSNPLTKGLSREGVERTSKGMGNLSSAPSASIVENSDGSSGVATAKKNLNSDGGGVAAIGEHILGSDCGAAPHGEQNLGGTSFVTPSNIPIISSDWESESDDTANLNYEDFFNKGEDEYGSDVHDEKSFKAGARRCIGFDGCFLKGVCKGQLLVAVFKDGNNQMLPLAWAVVEVENTFNWR